MKTLTTILLVSGLAVLNPVSATAQEQQPQPQGIPIMIGLQCDTKEEMTAVIKKYGELPFIEARGQMILAPQGVMLPGTVKLWANPDTWSYSITIEDIKPQNNVMCMLTSGDNLKPATEAPTL